MLELIIALLFSLGVITSGEDINQNVIQDNQDLIRTHIIEDDVINI